MLSGRAMYVWNVQASLNQGTVAAMVAKAVRAKLSSLWVKIGDGADAYENIQGANAAVLNDLVAGCNAAGIAVFGYHVPHCADNQAVTDEVNFVKSTVNNFKLAGVVIDNEDGSSYFRGTAQCATAYGQGIQSAMHAAGKIAVMSSNDIISAHPNSFGIEIGACVDVNAPQVYYGQSPSVNNRLQRAIGENQIIQAPFFPVGAAFLRKPSESDGGFLDPVQCGTWASQFIQLVSQLHRSSPTQYPGYGFWNWQEAPDQVWQVLFSTDVFPTAVVQTEFAAKFVSGITLTAGQSLDDILKVFEQRANCVAFNGTTAADLNLPGNTLVVVDENLFYSFRTADIVDEEPLGAQKSRVWVRTGSRAWRSGAISIGGTFKLRETMVGMEDLPEPPTVEVPGMPTQASDMHVQELRKLTLAAGTIAAAAAAYNGKCIGGDSYKNNCAHFLSDAFIRAGFSELAAGGSADHFITARCDTSAKRAIRARDMWQWFQSKATQTSNTITRNTGMWAVFQLDETKYWGGHVLIIDTDAWVIHGTGTHPTWGQHAYQW
jgi:hypothetical protein